MQAAPRDKDQPAAKSNASSTVRAIAADLTEENQKLERLSIQRNQLSALKSSLNSVEMMVARVPDQSAAAAALATRVGQLKIRTDEVARQIGTPQRITEVPQPAIPPAAAKTTGANPQPVGTTPPGPNPVSVPPANPLAELRADAVSVGEQIDWMLNNTQYAAQPVEAQLSLVGQLIEAARHGTGPQTTALVLPASVSSGPLYGLQPPYGPPARSPTSQLYTLQQGGAGLSFAARQSLPQTSAVLDRLARAQAAADLPGADLWQAATAELAGLPKALDATTSQSRLKAAYEQMKTRLDGYLRDVAVEIEEGEKKRDELNSRLRDTDTFIGQSQINFYLVFAVYGMIAIIGGVFFVLATKKENDIIRVLIRERILIEVLSMGFLLLTVIILGTGKIVDKEGLAALLGTIAGYIFGQKAANQLARAVQRPPAPAAQLSAVPTAGPAPLDVEFTDESTNDPTKWKWDFGDGGTSSERSPKHRYAAPGVHIVTLRASNDGGSNEATRTITVTDGQQPEQVVATGPPLPAAPPPAAPPVVPPATAPAATPPTAVVPPAANGQPPEARAARRRRPNRAQPQPDSAV